MEHECDGLCYSPFLLGEFDWISEQPVFPELDAEANVGEPLKLKEAYSYLMKWRVQELMFIEMGIIRNTTGALLIRHYINLLCEEMHCLRVQWRKDNPTERRVDPDSVQFKPGEFN